MRYLNYEKCKSREMEQNVAEADSLNLGEYAKREESWAIDRDVNASQQKQAQDLILFYKYDDNGMPTNDLNELPTNTRWWRDAFSEDVKSTLKSETLETYPLIEQPMDPQMHDIPQSLLSANSENSAKSLIKYKQAKKMKSPKEHKESMKRPKHPENWKVNVKKNARLKGEEYIGVGGKIVPAKKMGCPCVCRMHCADKIDEKEREELHKVFWKTCTWQQRKQYIALSVKESPKQRTRLRANVQSTHTSPRHRQVTFTYSLLLKGEFTTVCKSMFLSTFAVSEKFVRHVMEKKRMSPGGIIGPDQRGKHTPKTKKSEDVKERVREHIRSFPSEKSTDSKDRNDRRYLDTNLNIAAMHKFYVLKCKQEGVPEDDIVKESYYREIFKTEFNLGFRRVQTKKKKWNIS